MTAMSGEFGTGSKGFFFEKKKQKTFANQGSLYPGRPQPKQSKVFCFLFSKKKFFLTLVELRARQEGR
jgi:hypothetical protein